MTHLDTPVIDAGRLSSPSQDPVAANARVFAQVARARAAAEEVGGMQSAAAEHLSDKAEALQAAILSEQASSLAGAMAQAMAARDLIEVLASHATESWECEQWARRLQLAMFSIVSAIEASTGEDRAAYGGDYWMPKAIDPHDKLASFGDALSRMDQAGSVADPLAASVSELETAVETWSAADRAHKDAQPMLDRVNSLEETILGSAARSPEVAACQLTIANAKLEILTHHVNGEAKSEAEVFVDQIRRALYSGVAMLQGVPGLTRSDGALADFYLPPAQNPYSKASRSRSIARKR